MNQKIHLRFSGCLLILAFLSACEQPQQRIVPVPEEKKAPEVIAPSSLLSISEPVAEIPEKKDPEKEEIELPPAEPELSVAMVGDKILISGALRSRIQQERINETLTLAFPDHTIESDLKVEYHRIPVGWGNRVADAFIAPFLHQAKSAKVVYKDGVLTLEGEVESARKLREFTEIAIEAFSGSTTEKIDNKITVKP